MPAPKNNKFGEKWPEEAALELIDKAISIAQEDVTIRTLGTVAKQLGIYETAFTYLKDKYKEFARRKRELSKILANNIINDAIEGKTNASISIFVLKNHHGYSDKKDIDVTSQGEKIQSNVFLLPEIEGDEEE